MQKSLHGSKNNPLSMWTHLDIMEFTNGAFTFRIGKSRFGIRIIATFTLQNRDGNENHLSRVHRRIRV